MPKSRKLSSQGTQKQFDRFFFRFFFSETKVNRSPWKTQIDLQNNKNLGIVTHYLKIKKQKRKRKIHFK